MLQLIRHQVGRDNYYKIWHKPLQNILLYIHEGQGSLVTTDNVTPIGKGSLCFIGSQLDHYTLPDLNQRYERSKVMVDDATLVRLTALLGLNLSPRDYRCVTVADGESIFTWMENYGIISGLPALMGPLAKSDPAQAAATTIMERAIAYIHEHIQEELDIDQICAAVPVSKYHFCRTFKSTTGMTVMKYILKTRVLLARQRIEQGERNMAFLSGTCGFSCQSHFSRAFKEETGLSPMQYRKELLRQPKSV